MSEATPPRHAISLHNLHSAFNFHVSPSVCDNFSDSGVERVALHTRRRRMVSTVLSNERQRGARPVEATSRTRYSKVAVVCNRDDA